MMGRNDETIFLQLLFNSLINMYLILYLLMAFLPPPSLPLSIPPTVSNPPSQFPLLIPLITSSLTDNTFISCRIKFTKTSLIDCRRITLKSGDHLQLNYKQSTSDTALNVPLSKDCSQVTAKLLSLPSPTAAALKTLTSDYTLKNNTLHAAPPTTTTLPSSAHDRAKTQPIPPTATFLQLLNVTTSTGKPYVKMSNKLRQINQFVAVLEPRLPKVDASTPFSTPLQIYDLGCGKGYLTFAIHNHLQKTFPNLQTTGIDFRPSVAATANAVAQVLPSFANLTFIPASISTLSPALNSIVIALHACDTATDDALYAGVSSQARLIVTAPCCHKEVRRLMRGGRGEAHPYGALFKYGIYEERLCESVTDALRGLMLELFDYDVDIFEFIGGEHTAKNVMITAVRRRVARSESEKEGIRGELEKLAGLHGIEAWQLSRLLKVEIGGRAPLLTTSNMPAL